MVTTRLAHRSQLRQEYQTLIKFMQKLNFGKIKNLVIRDGVPILRPAPVTIKTLKLGNEYRRRPEIDLDDFALKSEVRDLIEVMNRIQNGVVLSIQVKNGLPFLIKVEESVN